MTRIAILAAIALIFITTPVQAQIACDTRDSIVETLGKVYGEVRRGRGMAGPLAIFEIWASEETGSWTILKTTPNGLTCIMAVGDGWHDDTGELTPSGSPV